MKRVVEIRLEIGHTKNVCLDCGIPIYANGRFSGAATMYFTVGPVGVVTGVSTPGGLKFSYLPTFGPLSTPSWRWRSGG